MLSQYSIWFASRFATFPHVAHAVSSDDLSQLSINFSCILPSHQLVSIHQLIMLYDQLISAIVAILGYIISWSHQRFRYFWDRKNWNKRQQATRQRILMMLSDFSPADVALLFVISSSCLSSPTLNRICGSISLLVRFVDLRVSSITNNDWLSSIMTNAIIEHYWPSQSMIDHDSLAITNHHCKSSLIRLNHNHFHHH